MSDRDQAQAMLMMDGKLLTVNMLLSALRSVAIKSLGIEASADPEEEERSAKDIQNLMLRLAEAGLKDILRTKTVLGWDDIRSFSQRVVDKVNGP